MSVTIAEEILTIADVAAELRCSKAHVCNAIKGKVAGVSALPAICMGRRRLIRRSVLEQWKRANERLAQGDMIQMSPEVDAVRPVGEEPYES